MFKGTNKKVEIWPENDVVGRHLLEPILENIENSDCVICDITKVNFNVVFEAGYSIGKGKKTLFVVNNGILNDSRLYSTIGIFDTIGYATYQNTNELAEVIGNINLDNPIFTKFEKDNTSPIYTVEMPIKSDAQTRIISRIKKTRLRYRSFNPQEHIRLSGLAAVQHVASSSGILVPIASASLVSAEIHNIRAAFVAGLALGMSKPSLLLQDYDGPAPLDVRDQIKTYKHPDDINDYVADFAGLVVEELQAVRQSDSEERTLLSELVLGDPMAENEMTTLAEYYLATDEFMRVARGEVNLVVGRKGMGKTALFIQLRDKIRKNRNNIVVDLKPEGYQLRKLREDVFDLLSAGSVEHLIVAFWEYLLYLEIAYKIVEKDINKAKNDHIIREKFQELINVYEKISLSAEADFSERLSILVSDIRQTFESMGRDSVNRLTSASITEIVHSQHLPSLRAKILNYLKYKDSVWVLFDNLDKGWPVQGIDETDAVILRSLIDAGKKIRKDLTKGGVDAYAIVFVRNDVYDILMQNSADFGKEIRVQLDWSDRDLIKQLTARRLEREDKGSENIWETYFESLFHGEYSFDYVIERSLMRPRNIIKIMYHARGYAVNMRHQRITEEDIAKALKVYSNDVLEEADEELSDIEPRARGMLYNFIGSRAELDRETLILTIMENELSEDDASRIIDYLLYFGFYGVKIPNEDPRFIYDFHYNAKTMAAWSHKNRSVVSYYMNPAFWPALEIMS